MKLCVAGWYYRPQLMQTLNWITDRDKVFVIKHRDGNCLDIPSKQYPNLGLEFGAYRQYVENEWDGMSDVLFMHDDACLSGKLSVLDDIASLRDMGVEQAYIFHDENEEYINGGIHGRALWIRADVLKLLSKDFPADMENTGTNIGVVAQKGILEFHKRIMELGHNTGVIAIHPLMRFAHRGRLHDKMFVYRKTHHPVPGGLVHVPE